MKTLQIYDPPLCCSSGLCGPSLDPVLIQVNDAVLALRKQGVIVKRFNLAKQLGEVMSNPTVADLIHREGKEILPVTLADGRVIKTGAYPAYEECCEALGIEPADHRPMTLM